MNDADVTPQPAIENNLGLDTEGNGGRPWKRRIIQVLLVILVIIGIVKFFAGKEETKITYTTQTVKKGDLTITVTATGNLEPTNQVEVGSELSGIVESVDVDYNQHVTKGEVLATLDTSKLFAQVLHSRASLASARAKVMQTKATIKEAGNEKKRLEKVRKLSAGKAVSQHDLDAAEAALERAIASKAAAEAEVSQAQATLDEAQTDLSKAKIRSPVNGVVLIRSVDPGQTVAASLQAPVLFTLAEDLTHMELHVDVDEADVGRVQEEQSAKFTVDAYPDRSYPAKIVQVRYGSKTVEGVVTYETVLLVNNEDLSLRPGMTATADIIVKQVKNAVLVPNSAFRFVPQSTDDTAKKKNQGSILSKLFPRRSHNERKLKNNQKIDKKATVWRLENIHPVAVAVTTGATDGIMTEILEGDVTPGMKLVVDSRSVSK